MAVITTDKIVIIVVVTVIVIILAYVFRFGRFSRKKQAGANSERQPSPSGSSQGGLLKSSTIELSQQRKQ